MATEYRLILDTGTSAGQVAERALPDPAERPTGTPELLAADLYDRHGFELTIRTGSNGFFDAEADHGMWEWEPASYVALTFRMAEAESGLAVGAMLLVVRRVLRSGPEDAALMLNGNWLLLTRVGGVLAGHRASWWTAYPAANDLLLSGS